VEAQEGIGGFFQPQGRRQGGAMLRTQGTVGPFAFEQCRIGAIDGFGKVNIAQGVFVRAADPGSIGQR